MPNVSNQEGSRPANSFGFRRRDRDAAQAFEHYQQRPGTDWSEEPTQTPHEKWGNRKPTVRSQRGNPKGKPKKTNPPRQPEKEQPTPPVTVVATEEDTPQDEPLYDTTAYTAGNPLFQFYQQNFDLAGFEPLCSTTYEVLQGLDPKLPRDLPYAGFLHTMGTYVNAAVLDSVYDNQERKFGEYSERVSSVLPQEFTIPKPIVDYAQGFSKILTPDGSEVRQNVPAISIPLASYEDDAGNIIPSGTFGPVNAETHNVYECYICPYTTAQRVIESTQRELQPWEPLPEALMPSGGVPNQNFIGYAPIDALHTDARDALSRGSFEEGDDIAGRLCVNGNLFLKTTSKLNTLSKKFKMCKLNNTDPVKYKTQPANLLISRTNDEAQIIAGRSVTNSSSYQFGSNASGAAGIFVYHRERTPAAPGCCFSFDGH